MKKVIYSFAPYKDCQMCSDAAKFLINHNSGKNDFDFDFDMFRSSCKGQRGIYPNLYPESIFVILEDKLTVTDMEGNLILEITKVIPHE